MFKIVKDHPFTKKEWSEYVLWRNYGFSSFESVDSTLRGSKFTITVDDDWDHVLTIGSCLTDILKDVAYAKKCSLRYDNAIVVGFDIAGNGDAEEHPVIGYDILDGQLAYSLLTNFGNDIVPVNSVLAKNALIRHYQQAREAHGWFLKNMADDAHVKGSQVVCVYGSV